MAATQIQKDVGDTTTTTASIACTYATAPKSGNLLLAALAWSQISKSVSANPTGWATCGAGQVADNTDAHIEWWFKYADGTEGASYTPTWTLNATTTAHGVLAYEYSGISPGGPHNVDKGAQRFGQTTATTGATGALPTPNEVCFMGLATSGAITSVAWDNGGATLDIAASVPLNRYHSGIATRTSNADVTFTATTTATDMIANVVVFSIAQPPPNRKLMMAVKRAAFY